MQIVLLIYSPFAIGRFLDPIARKELWRNGLNYRHGTGHGIGMFLSVHEGELVKRSAFLGLRFDYLARWGLVNETFSSGYSLMNTLSKVVEDVVIGEGLSLVQLFPRWLD